MMTPIMSTPYPWEPVNILSYMLKRILQMGLKILRRGEIIPDYSGRSNIITGALIYGRQEDQSQRKDM